MDSKADLDESTTTATMANPSSLVAVDGEINKRCAGVCRLQQKQNRGGVGGIISGSKKGLIRHNSSRGGGLGVAATAALVNRTAGVFDVVGKRRKRTTPFISTAVIARRLDAPYAPSKNLVAVAAQPPPAKRQQQHLPSPQSMSSTNTMAVKTDVGKFRPSSEIFHTGIDRMFAASPGGSSGRNTWGKFRARKRQGQKVPDVATHDLSSPKRRPRIDSRGNILPHSPLKSTLFGSALANSENSVPVLPVAIPLLTVEPSTTVDHNFPVSKTEQIVLSAKASSAKNQQQQFTSQQPERENEIGRSTPAVTICSAGEDESSKDQSLSKALIDKNLENAPRNNELNIEERKKEEGTGGLTKDDRVDVGKASPSNMPQLMSDLKRIEEEKKAVLQQVNMLKSLLDQGEQEQNASRSKQQLSLQKSEQRPPLVDVNSNQSGNSSDVSGLLDQFKEVVFTQGDSAAVAWISNQLENCSKKCYSPPSSSIDGNDKGRVARREETLSYDTQLLAPHSVPGTHDDNDGERMVSFERENIEHQFLIDAAKSIPNEYRTYLASYLVRQPYIGVEGQINHVAAGDNDSWESYSHLTGKEQYLPQATAFEPSSLEILAYIEADGSVFTLSGKSNARHGKLRNVRGENAASSKITKKELLDWSVFDDVEEIDRALGLIEYIDVEGNERKYWLDSIYEEALTARESYCTSMISAAFALKEITSAIRADNLVPMQSLSPTVQPRQQPSDASLAGSIEQPPTDVDPNVPMQPSLMHLSNASSTHSMPTAENIPPIQMQDRADKLTSPMPTIKSQLSKPDGSIACTKDNFQAMSNLPASEPKSNLVSPKEKVRPPPSTSVQKKSSITTKPPPSLEECEFDSADSALPFLVISLFSLFYSMVWFLVKIPIRIGSILFTFCVLVVVFRTLWLFLADDYGAWEIGAGVEHEYNMPGIH